MINIHIASKTIDIAENDLYLDLTNRLCYYDDSNLNGVMLPYKGYEETALEFANSLINMPLQAKYRKINNKDDLGSHECSRDNDGNVVFGTESIGVHISVEIKEDTVTTVHGEEKTLPCLFATARVWKRNKNIINAIQRLFSEDKLNSSWEIATDEYLYTQGKKILTKYSFMSNCLLGSKTTPAYSGTSKSLEISSDDISEDELLIAEAISKDILENGNIDGTFESTIDDIGDFSVSYDTSNIDDNKEVSMGNTKNDNTIIVSEDLENQVDSSEVENSNDTNIADNTDNVDNTNITIENSDGDENNKDADIADIENSTDDQKDITTDISDDTSKDISSLTVRDIMVKIEQECEAKLDTYCNIFVYLPEEKTVWIKKWDWNNEESELTYYVFTYEVNGDVITVSEPVKGELVIKVTDVNSTISSLNEEISKKNEALISANELIQNKDNEIASKETDISSKCAEIAELKVYKDKFEIAERDKIEAELLEQRKELKDYAIASNLFTEEELNFEVSELNLDNELQKAINELNKGYIKSEIAERFMNSLSNNKQTNVVETSQTNENNNKKDETVVTSSLDADDTLSNMDKASIFRSYMFKRNK